MTGITLFSLPALFIAALLNTTSVLQYLLLSQMEQEREEIYSEHKCQSYMKLSTTE
jgi:hypothetical protein